MTDGAHGRTSPRPRGEDGFTIIEIMVAMLLLVVGVLGGLVMLQGSLTSTQRTTAREQGTNVARDLVERSREVPYSSTTTSAAPAALAAVLPEHPTVSSSSFTVRRRGIDYAVTVNACSIDDPSDGAGLGNTTFCARASTGPSSPPVGSGLAVSYNVLGVPVSLAAGGSLLNTVCQAVGTDTAIANQVGSLAASATTLASLTGNGAQVLACPVGYGGSVAYDFTPDDLRRVRIRVQWAQGSGPASSLTQTTLLSTPA